MLRKGGGAEEASRTRVRCDLRNFNDLPSILTLRRASLSLKGKIYKVCSQTVLVNDSDTWAMKVNDIRRLERSENTMLRWMCLVTLKDKRSTTELMDCLGVVFS